MSSIEAALTVIKLLEPGEQFSYRQIAAQYHCNRTTLARRHKAVSVSRENEAQNRQALHSQQEQELVRYIERLTSQGLPPTWPMIRRFASDIMKKELGKGWVDRFIQRYHVDLIPRSTTGIDRSRHQADSELKHRL
jgi:hypothetical protein